MAFLLLFFALAFFLYFGVLIALLGIWMLKLLVLGRRHRLGWFLALLSLPFLGAALHRLTHRPRYHRF